MKKLILISTLLSALMAGTSDYQPMMKQPMLRMILRCNKLAEKTDKYILLEMGGNWCPDCRTLGEYFAREDIKSWLDERFIVVAVDVGEWDKNLDIAERYGNPISEGIPSLVVLDAEGNLEFATLAGELATARNMSGDDLIEWLKTKIQPILD